MGLSAQALTPVQANPDVPISGAMIIATGPEGYGFDVTTPEGRYIITQGLKAGTYNVSALAEGYISKNVGGVSVTVGVETKNINFSLKRSGGVSGKVTDSASGKPLANVMITASSQNQFGWFALTDSDGNYKIITNLASGTYNVSAVFLTGYFSKTISGVSVTAGVETKGINLALDGSGVISGKVTSSSGGQPLKGVMVTSISSDGKGFTGFAQTESDGTYKINSGLGTGKYMVTASSGMSFDSVQNVNVVAGQETSNVNLVLNITPPQPSGTIRGKVTDTSNKPIEGATVSAGSGHDSTDANGDYEISSGLPTGTYTVEVTMNGYIPQNKTGVTVTAGSVTSNINFQMPKIPLEQSGKISGTVTGEENPLGGKPATSITCAPNPTSAKLGDSITVSGAITPAVAGAKVSLDYKMGSTEVSRDATTGSDGKYSDTYQPTVAGSWTVSASWTGNTQYNGAVSQPVAFTVSQPPSTGSVKVTVKDKDGKPIVGASISSTSQPSGQSALNGVSGSDGSASFTDVKPGSYTFQGSMSGYVSASGTGNVAAGSSADVSIILQAQSSGGGGGGGIPGYPYEALVVGIVLACVLLWLLQRRS
jgi:hypothetical protein